MCRSRRPQEEWEAIPQAFAHQGLPPRELVIDGRGLSPSDLGLDGAIPLGPGEASELAALIGAAEWSTPNRRANDRRANRRIDP